MAHLHELGAIGIGQRMRETLRVGMSEDDEVFHGAFSWADVYSTVPEGAAEPLI
jgi:hypothetical protein